MAGNPKFTVLYEKMRGKSFDIDRDIMSIGRRDGMDICIKEPGMSGHHADIIRGEKGGKFFYTLRDNNSTNGTRINNVPVKEQELKNSDLILFGSVEVLFDGIDDEDTTPSQMFGTQTHTIDLSSIDNTGTTPIQGGANLNPFAARDQEKHAKVQKVLVIGSVLLGIAVAGVALFAIWRMFSI